MLPASKDLSLAGYQIHSEHHAKSWASRVDCAQALAQDAFLIELHQHTKLLLPEAYPHEMRLVRHDGIAARGERCCDRSRRGGR